MPGSFKTEAIVLRSIRYGEADRILHLYSRERGRVGAVAKGVRRVKSRFGGRLEPLFRVSLVLHEGRGELHGHVGADGARARRPAREPSGARRATEACEAVLRLFDSAEANLPAYNLLCHELALLDVEPGRRRTRAGARVPAQAAAGGRLRARAASCASCGEARAPRRVLRRRGRRRVRRRARRARSRWTRRRTTSSWRRSRARSRRRRRRPTGRSRRPTGRSRRRWSTTPTCVSGGRLEGYLRAALAVAAIRSSSTTSPRARGTCASCSAARAPTSPR